MEKQKQEMKNNEQTETCIPEENAEKVNFNKAKTCVKCSSIFDIVSFDEDDVTICWSCMAEKLLMGTDFPAVNMSKIFSNRENVLMLGIDFREGVLRALNVLRKENSKTFNTLLNYYRLYLESICAGRPDRSTARVLRKCHLCKKMRKYIYGILGNDDEKLCCFNCRGKIYLENFEPKRKRTYNNGAAKREGRFSVDKIRGIHQKLFPSTNPSSSSSISASKLILDEIEENSLQQKMEVTDLKEGFIFHVGDLVSLTDTRMKTSYYAQITELFENNEFPRLQKARVQWLYPDLCNGITRWQRGPTEPRLRELHTLKLESRCPPRHILSPTPSSSSSIRNVVSCDVHEGSYCKPHLDKLEVIDGREKDFCSQFLSNPNNSATSSSYTVWRRDWRYPTPYQLKYCRRALDKKWFPLARQLGYCKRLVRKEWLASITEQSDDDDDDDEGGDNDDDDSDDSASDGGGRISTRSRAANGGGGGNNGHKAGKMNKGPGRPRGARGRPKRSNQGK